MSEPLRRGAAGTREVLEGTIGRVQVDVGSKSERSALGMATERGFALLHVVGDLPFAEPTLVALEGKRVRVEGIWRSGTLRVDRGALGELVEPEAAEDAHRRSIGMDQVAPEGVEGRSGADPMGEPSGSEEGA